MPTYPLKKLSEICIVIAGQSPEGKFYNQKGEGLPFYQGKKEFGEKYIGEPTTWTTGITKEAIKDDILMSVRAPVGPINFSTDKICIGRGLAAIRPGKNVDKDYLYNFLLSIQDLISGNTGAVFDSINKKQIEEIEIPLPPLSVQEEIVAKLDAALASIDEAKAKTEQALAATRELWGSTLEEAFRGGDGWGKRNLNEISDNLDNRRKPITKKVRSSGKYPYYGASGIVDYVADYIFDEDALLISEDGANLLARSTPIAFSASGKYWVNNHAHILKFSNKITQKFVELYLNSIPLDDFITGAAQPKLNQKQLNSIPIPFPDIAEQSRIVAHLDAVRAETDRLALLYEQKLADLDELRRSVLQEAFAQNT